MTRLLIPAITEEGLLYRPLPSTRLVVDVNHEEKPTAMTLADLKSPLI